MSDDIFALISKVATKEQMALKTEFVAPVNGNEIVTASVLGIAYPFEIRKPPKEPGWYKFKPIDSKRVKVVGPAELSECEVFFKRMPAIRVVLMNNDKGFYRGVAVRDGSHGFSHTSAVEVYLVDDYADDFDLVVCRYDGCNLWYERPDQSNDPSKGEYLRSSFAKAADPKTLKYKGLTFTEKSAYAVRYAIDTKVREELRTRGLKTDVEHAGGVFIGMKERSDRYEVTYTVDGHQYTSFVDKTPTRMVISAGVCLSGGDDMFDLKSLITVMREGQRRDLIHRVGRY